MKYYSTRGEGPISGSQAIINGLAKDGGLYVPETFPQFTFDDLEFLSDFDYYQRAAYIISKFLPEFTYDELVVYTKAAYDKFDGYTTPLTKLDCGMFLLELWHGPTCAFKDVALTLLPYLITASKKKQGNDKKTLILVATSGDTGKAALEGFKDVEGTEICVLYPSDGVSDMQKLQMITTEGKNTHVIGIKGNFDDAQRTVKEIFSDPAMVKKFEDLGYELSSANSINFGRLVPQVVYYISSYIDLVLNEEIKMGDPVNVVVPCGNFGNILAAYYAKKCGIPLSTFVVASNKNDVLTEFFANGDYDANRDFHKTMSPSMDILVSSNLERYLYEIYDHNPDKVRNFMNELKNGGFYSIGEEDIENKAFDFIGYSSTEEETRDTIANFYDEYGYILDPHTAVAVSAFFKYSIDFSDINEEGEDIPSIVVSTASPYKFPQDVLEAITKKREDDAFKAGKKLAELDTEEPPESIATLKEKPILHPNVCTKEKIKETIIDAVSHK